MRIPVRVLKNELSKYLRQIHEGNEIIVTYHDHPIAKIVPFIAEEGAPSSKDIFLSELKHCREKSVYRGKALSEIVLNQRAKERY